MNESYPCPKCGQPVPTDAPEGLCPRCLGALNLDSETGIPGAAATAPPPSAAELAPHFPQLEILELLGRGGMGVVYKVRQKELDRIAALKILPPGIGPDPAFAERFAREAKALARLNHPGIVTIYDSGRTDGLYYFLMEFVDGVSLGRLMRGTRVSPREALAIVPQICDALQYAHDQGIVHRDIKPENILLDRQGRVKVADFGLAKLMAGTQQPLTPSRSPSDGERVAGRPGEGGTAAALTDAGKILGTPAYMAPEQAEHPAEVDHRADIYALGVVFYQMLTGELPGKRIEPPSKKVQIDVRLDEVVLRALEKEPERRYQNASELRTVVETVVAETMKLAAAGGAPGTAPGSVPWGAAALPAMGWSRAAIAGAACIGFFLIVQVLWFLGWPPSGDPSFGRTLPQLVFYRAVLPGAFAALLASTILGWAAVARIRRSAGRLRGLGLAAFDGLFLPLLTVDLVILVAWAIAIKALAAHRGLGGSMFRNLWDFAGFVLLLGLVAGGVDYLLLKPIWRAIAGSAGGDAPRAAARRRRRLLLLAAILGLVVMILYPAYVIHSENSRKARYGWGVEAGTELHYQVFEADAARVDRLVPFAVREPGNAIASAGTYTLRPSYTAVAQMAGINDAVLAALLQSAATNAGLLTSATKKGEEIYQWCADAWGYTNALASGRGVGFCGMGRVGRDLGSVRFRIRYRVSHTVSGNARYPVTAEISYEGEIPPPGKARAFFIPFGRDQEAKYLVIAFSAANAKAKAPAAASPAQPPPNGAPHPVAATAAIQGDIAVRLEALGTVESSNAVSFAIAEDYCQQVVRKFDTRQELNVVAYDRQGRKFGHGALVAVDNRIDPATGTLNCKASLVPEGENLMVPGLYLTVRMLLAVKHGVTLVPEQAVFSDAQGPFVWTIKPDQTASRRRVQVGTRDGAAAEIQGGLSPGERVVSGGAEGLQAGQKVHCDLAPPAASAQAGTQAVVTDGATATFSLTASGTAPLYYQWVFNGTSLALATNDAPPEVNAPTNQPPASPPTVEQIVARYAQAKGEMAGPDKTRTLILMGRFTSRDSLGTHEAQALIKSPDKWLLSLQDTNGPFWRRAFDGSAAWEIAKWGSPEVDPGILLSAQVLISLYRGDPLNPFIRIMSLKGQEPIGGEQAYVVAVALPGLAPRLWFDTQSGLLVRIEYDVAGSVMQMDFGDYRNIGGLKVPFNIREAGTESWTIQCSEVKRNEPIEDSRFKRPASQ